MASAALPSCLSCGRLMHITKSQAAGPGFELFERQQLKCQSCGDTDSRFVFLSGEVQQPVSARIEDLAFLPLANTSSAPSVPVIENAPSVEDAPSHVPEWSWENADSALETFPTDSEPPNAEPAPAPEVQESGHRFAEALQNYLVRWRQTHKI
jgi:hypothetical protein